MDAKEIKEGCMEIFEIFDGLDSVYVGGVPGGEIMECALSEFFNSLIFDDEFNRVFNNEDDADVARQLFIENYNVSFAIGYVMGQTLDILYPAIQENIKAIMAVLREKRVLPYFPRKEV